MLHRTYSVLCRMPVGVRLAMGFLFAGLIAALGVGFVGLLPTRESGQVSLLLEQMSTANNELATALVLLHANDTNVHLMIEDGMSGQPHSVLMSDQAAVQRSTEQYETEITTFIHDNLLDQQPSQEELIIGLGQGAAIEQQRGLVISVTYTWQRYRAAQTQVLQALLNDQFNAAETLERSLAESRETEVLSALYSLIQFQDNLAQAVQNTARGQAIHNQHIAMLLGSIITFCVILIAGLLVTGSLVDPLHRLRRVTQAAASGEHDARVAVIGCDEVADISSRVNDMLASIDSLLAEVNRQHYGQISAAERLVSGVSGRDTDAVRAQVAEVGDSLKVLETVCSDVLSQFQAISSSVQSAAQQLEAIAQRTRSLAETVLVEQQGTSIEFVQEIMTVAQQIESISHTLAASLSGLRASAA
jgi:methyl-accepting chemotaxis protein